MIGGVRNWLTVADAPAPADLIFTLAGARGRKQTGLQLLREGYAPAILFSVGRFEIRRFSDELKLSAPYDLRAAAAQRPPSSRHIFALYRGVGAIEPYWMTLRGLGTLTEIRCLADWIEHHPEIHSLLVVSSGFHLRRVRLCCLALLPRVSCRMVAVPEQAESWSTGKRTRLMLMELLKYPLYKALFAARSKAATRWLAVW